MSVIPSRPRISALLVSLVAPVVPVLSGTAQGQGSPFYDERVIPQIEIRFSITDWRAKLKDNYQSNNGEYVEADLVIDGVLVPRVGVEHKGDASYRGDYRENMKFTLDAFVPGQEYLGFDKITVDAGHQTNVFTEVCALWVMGEFQEVPQANLAHVVAVDPEHRRDLGVFTNTERVEGRFVDRRFVGDGHRYWQNFAARPYEYKGAKVSDYYSKYRYTGGDFDTRFEDIAAASIALENAPRGELRDLLDPLLDMDACLRNIVVNRLLGNFDGLEAGNNFYLVESVRHGSRTVPVPWDMDFSFTSSANNPVPVDGDGTDFPLKKLFTAKVESQRAYGFVRQFLDRSFAPGEMEARLLALMELALPDMLGSRFDPITSRQEAEAAVHRCVHWMDQKRDQLANEKLYQRNPLPLGELTHTPDRPREGEPVWVTVQVPAIAAIDRVLVWSRTRGAFVQTKMSDDGAHEDGAADDGLYGAELPAAAAGETVQYYVEVRPADLDTHFYTFLPEETSYRPREFRVRLASVGDLALDEFLADNANTDFDEFLEAEDWIEVVDRSGTGRDLGGTFLSDDPLRPEKWRVPDGTFLAAHGRLRFWADDEEEQGPLHTNFRLAKSGGSLFLRSAPAQGAVLLDEVDYGVQREDHSYGRLPDGEGNWFHFWRPTALLPAVQPGKGNRFDLRPEGSPRGLDLELDGTPKVGKEMRLEIFDGTPGGLVWILASAMPASIDFGSRGPLLVDPRGWLVLRMRLDADGEAKLRVDVGPELGGLRFYAQALEQDLSNGLVVEIAH